MSVVEIPSQEIVLRSKSVFISFPESMKAWLTKREVMIAFGLVYLAVGVGLLWLYIFSFTALSSARHSFEIAKAEHAKLVAMKDIAERMVGGGGSLTATNLSMPEVLKGFLRGVSGSMVNQQIQAVFSSAGAFDEIERLAWFKYTNTLKYAETSRTNEYALIKAKLPTHVLFSTYLEYQHEDLYDSMLVQAQLKDPVSKLNLRSFIFLGLGFGLVCGGYNLLKLSSKDERYRKEKHYLWPLGTPVLAVIMILLLTGFGPVFSEAVDVSTARFLMILCVIIGLNPEHFLFTFRRWANEVWTGLSGVPGGTPARLEQGE